MSNRIYLGNLSFETTEDTLRQLLSQDGRTVAKVDLKVDSDTGRSRGFAFADLGSSEEAEAAIAALDGSTVDGRPIKVKSARDKMARSGGFGRSDGGGGDRDHGGGHGGRRGGGRW